MLNWLAPTKLVQNHFFEEIGFSHFWTNSPRKYYVFELNNKMVIINDTKNICFVLNIRTVAFGLKEVKYFSTVLGQSSLQIILA